VTKILFLCFISWYYIGGRLVTIKIIHIITSLNVGGAEQALKRLVLSDNATQKPVVISLTNLGIIGAELRANNVEVHALAMHNLLFVPITIFRLFKLIKALKPDIVQTWLYHADLIGGLAAKFVGIKSIIWGVRTTELKKGAYVTTIIRKLLAWLSYVIPLKVICVAQASKQKHIEVGYCPKKMKVIGNGFNLKQLQFNSKQRQLLRQTYGFSDEHIVIGSVGRFSQDKGQDIFIQSAVFLIEKHPNIRFLMVGRELDENNVELMGWLKKANIASYFQLLGERPDVNACLSAMDVFCLHSRTEGFPNVLGEAMAVGLPCVATNVGDSAFILGNTGVLAEKIHAQSLANATNILLKYTQAERKIIGEKAKQRIMIEFTQKKTNQQYQSLYKSLYNRDTQ
jgi:glycosyltransferase involved in cell wall biosynthesis